MKFPPRQCQCDGNTCPGHSVLQQQWTWDKEQTASHQRVESCTSASFAIPNPRHLTGSRIGNSILSSSHIIPSFQVHRSLFPVNMECKPQQNNVQRFTILWALRRDWTRQNVLLVRWHFKGLAYRGADWTQLRPWKGIWEVLSWYGRNKVGTEVSPKDKCTKMP